ncbi:sigma-70 family RNA polymerase sigma factor [Candidatus Pacearchaeota archaeon]|nr:MAG: sigma-70 family RNA polymerase sigma factor [Candidatus Pacearchaeota archaeon]
MRNETLESKVRKLDDGITPIKTLAKLLARRCGASPLTVEAYIRAKRKGYSSHMQMVLASHGYTRIVDYLNEKVRAQGWKSWSDYCTWRAIDRGATCTGYRTKHQKSFEEGIELLPPEQIEQMPDEKLSESLEKEKQLQAMREFLENSPTREFRILYMRFFLNMTLEQTGKALSIGKERARQLQERGIKLLSSYISRNGIEALQGIRNC